MQTDFAPSRGMLGFAVGEGRNVTFRPESPLEGMIGFDVTLDFVMLGLAVGGSFSLFSTSNNGFTARMTATETPPDSTDVICRLTVGVGDAFTSFNGLRFETLATDLADGRRLRIRWMTIGQLQVWLDDELIGHENGVGTGVRPGLVRLSLGDVDQPIGGVRAFVTYFRAIELREKSAVDEVGRLLDPEHIPEIPETCLKVAGAEYDRVMRAMRKLRAGFAMSQTSNWRLGDSGQPFSPTAQGLQDARAKAGRAVVDYLRDGGDDTRSTAAAHVKEVLTTLATDQPALFQDVLTKQKEAREAAQAHCGYALDEVRAANPALMKKLEALNADVETVLEALGG